MKGLQDLVQGFNTTPFLFIGSGLTRRYYGLPDWQGLLQIFASRISEDAFVYNKYMAEAKQGNISISNLYPRIATLIERDFNEKWFSDKNFRRATEDDCIKFISEGASPFKVEIAYYIKSNSEVKQEYQEEVQKLKALTNRSLSGIITTNYDCFLESISSQYNVYVGQEQLVFSAIQGVAEIYKTHGCVNLPESIIINEKDYEDFEKKNAYLAAKLMTLFVEYPIIFMGYSITDSNIRSILRAIIECLSGENAQKLQERFVFIDYDENLNNSEMEITPYDMNFGDKIISMTKVKLKNFGLLYDVLSKKRSALPAKLLRLFKKEFYDFTLTNEPTAHVRVVALDDEKVSNDQLIMAIGKASDFGLKGLGGLEASEWYRDIVKNDLEFSADEILKYAYPGLIKKTNILPLNKYCKMSKEPIPLYIEEKRSKSFDEIISNTFKKNREITISDRSIMGIWNMQGETLEKKTRLMAHLYEEEINVDELEKVLNDIFDGNKDVLDCATTSEKTNIRRLIRIYDYLKYGKEPQLEVNS